MPSYYFNVKTVRKGNAAAQANYVARRGKTYEDRTDLVATGCGNLPEWANASFFNFASAADRGERKNGAAVKETTFALPRELPLHINMEIVGEFCKKYLSGKPHLLAIHAPPAAIGTGLQPHVHILNSDRVLDEHQRSPQQHFARYNAANPEKGGCRKDSGAKTNSEFRQRLIDQRLFVAKAQNDALEQIGCNERVDHRSLRDRGVARAPEPKFGPLRARQLSEGQRQELRTLRELQRSEPTEVALPHPFHVPEV
ncbi:MAG: MobA/MobL family protein [Pseudomonadota bacterium]